MLQQLGPGGAQLSNVTAVENEIAAFGECGIEEPARCDQNPCVLAGGAGAADAVPDNSDQRIAVQVAHDPEAHGEMSGTNENAGQPFHGADFIDVPYCLHRFDLREQVCSLVSERKRKLPIVQAIVHAAAAHVVTTCSEWGKLSKLDNLPCVLWRVNHWDNDDARTDFQRAEDMIALAVRDAYCRDRATGLNGHAESFDLTEVGRPMLHLDPDRFEADSRGEFGKACRATVYAHPSQDPRLPRRGEEDIVICGHLRS